MNSIYCPCGSKKLFDDCCVSFIQHLTAPETAQQLMRSRYCATKQHDLEYLLSSWHHSTRPGNMNLSDLHHNRWTQLYIVNTIAGIKHDSTGVVEFVAYFSNQNSATGNAANENTIKKLHEKSNFVKHQGSWFYLDGKIINNSNFIPGRNSLCYCGSSLKFKNCCLQK